MTRVRRLLAWLTIEQYDEIDREYLAEDPRRRGLLWTLIAVALGLLVTRYFGREDHIESIGPVRRWMATLPRPELYPALYTCLFKLVGYFALPFSIVWIVSRRPLRDYGFRPSGGGRVLLLYALMLLAVLPLVYVASTWPEFLAKYPKYRFAGRSAYELVSWELGYALQFVLLEILFRGFALFEIARYLGHRAIFVMLVPYCMIHFAKPLPETLGSIVTGIALGTLALRTRSIYGGVVLHIVVAWTMDALALWHKGALQKLLAG